MSRRTIILLGCGVVAVVLGSLVLVFGRGGGAEATSPQVTVVVATEDLAPGTAADEAVTDGRLQVSEVDADDVGPGAIRSAAELSGRSIGVAVPDGAQLVDTDLVLVPLRGSTVAVPDGMQAVAIDVPFTAGGAGYISAGDRVDVLGLLDDAPGGRSTITVLRDVEVLDVSTEVAPRVASRSASQASTTTTVATATPASLTFLIAVPEGDVTRIVQAAGFHRLYLSLPGAQAADPGPVVSDVELVGEALMATPLVVLHGQDPEHAVVVAREMDALLEGVEVHHAPTADDLGRLLTDDDVAVLVATVRDGERGWNRLHVIRDALPDLVIVACVGPDEARGRIAQRHRDAVNAVVADSIPNDQLVATVRRVGGLRTRPHPEASLGDESWAVIGLAGGVGTTTIATLVAGQLARQRWTVLCDFDLRHGAIAGAVRAEPRYTIADLLHGDQEQMREAVLACIHPLDMGVGLLAGPDEGTSSVTWTPERAREVARAVARPAQILVTDQGDLPQRWYPSLDEYTDIVVVASHDIRCARRVGPACRVLEEVAPSATLHVVLNGARPNLAPSPAELESVMGRSWDAVVPDLDAVRVAHNDVSGGGLGDLNGRMPRELSAAISSVVGTTVAAAMRRRFRRNRTATPLRRTS